MKIKFINHACISIETEDTMIMFDPWFSGKIFNNSWDLLRETRLDDLDIRNLKFIAITHEHPDHLNWATLKQLIISKPELKIIIPKRRNSNVAIALRKMGFKVAEIPPNRELQLGNKLRICNFPSQNDSAYVVVADGKVILNQNDCYLTDQECKRIKVRYPDIDYHFVQFSLAGYYGNKAETQKLMHAKQHHIDLVSNYNSIFKSKVLVPFASFIYFCRPYNTFLNDWAVTMDDLDKEYQIVFFGDEVLTSKEHFNRSATNRDRWKEVFASKRDLFEPERVPKDLIKQAAQRYLDSIPPGIQCPPSTSFSFFDEKENLFIDFKNKRADFTSSSVNLAGVLTTYDMLLFFKNPWGADTLNITSCFEVRDEKLWKQNLIFKDTQYVR